MRESFKGTANVQRRRDELFARFEELGEAVVQENLETGLFQGDKATFATLWLSFRVQSRSDAREAQRDITSAAQIRIARSAKNAAWTAAIAATAAAVIAIVSAVIAYLVLQSAR